MSRTSTANGQSLFTSTKPAAFARRLFLGRSCSLNPPLSMQHERCPPSVSPGYPHDVDSTLLQHSCHRFFTSLAETRASDCRQARCCTKLGALMGGVTCRKSNSLVTSSPPSRLAGKPANANAAPPGNPAFLLENGDLLVSINLYKVGLHVRSDACRARAQARSRRFLFTENSQPRSPH